MFVMSSSTLNGIEPIYDAHKILGNQALTRTILEDSDFVKTFVIFGKPLQRTMLRRCDSALFRDERRATVDALVFAKCQDGHDSSLGVNVDIGLRREFTFVNFIDDAWLVGATFLTISEQ